MFIKIIQRKTFQEIITGLIVTIVGGILVAWVIQEGGRFQPESPTITPSLSPSPTVTAIMNTVTPISPSPTVTAIMNTVTPIYPYIIINNALVLPVNIFVDEIYKGQVEPNSLKTLMIDGFPSKVRWEVIKVMLGNEPIGDDMAGTFPNVSNGATIYIDNIVVDKQYFFPIMSNRTDHNCKIVINEGSGLNERQSGFLTPHTENVVFGYYYLFSNSNVTFHCDDKKGHWKILPDGNGGSIISLGSGKTKLLVIPP